MKQRKLLLILFDNICWNFLLVPKGFCRILSAVFLERRWLVSKDTLSTGDSTTDNSTEYSGTPITEDETKNKNQLLRWSCFSSSSETKTWMFRGRRWVMSSAVVTLWSVSLFIPPWVQFVKVVSGLEQMTRPGANNTEWKKKKTELWMKWISWFWSVGNMTWIFRNVDLKPVIIKNRGMKHRVVLFNESQVWQGNIWWWCRMCFWM